LQAVLSAVQVCHYFFPDQIYTAGSEWTVLRFLCRAHLFFRALFSLMKFCQRLLQSLLLFQRKTWKGHHMNDVPFHLTIFHTVYNHLPEIHLRSHVIPTVHSSCLFPVPHPRSNTE